MRRSSDRYRFEADRLAYWYLRLNGFLTIENFILHDEVGRQQRTDIDLMALRLPHRREAARDYGDQLKWMNDEPRFAEKKVPFGAFVEVTNGPCKLNGPWTDPKKGNMPRAIRAFGALPSPETDAASAGLYKTGTYLSQNKEFELGLISIGSQENPELHKQLPGVMQITFGEIWAFIFRRFDTYSAIKRERPQWDLDGHLLWYAFTMSGVEKEFEPAFVLVDKIDRIDQFDKFRQSRVYRGPRTQ
jgi:hypothetical protein